MTDVFSKEKRSEVMAKIKCKDTKPEILVRKFLFANGYRYRKNVLGLPGKPDIVLPKFKSTIFVNGCFWHKHDGCKFFVVPKTRTEWWMDKINGNVEKDRNNYEMLKSMGWKVFVVWECEIEKNIDGTMKKLIGEIRGHE